MASAGKGKGYVKPVEWWQHLRWRKRDQNKKVRQDGKKQTQQENSDGTTIGSNIRIAD